MTRDATVIRHVDFEDLGVFAPVLADNDYTVSYLQAGIDELTSASDADLLVVLGAPIGVGDANTYPFLAEEIAIIAERIDSGAPVLGVCLGAQLIAAALGAEVKPGEPEIGYAPIELTDAGHSSVLAAVGQTPVLHWHGDQIQLPEGATNLASTPRTPCQAFTVGDSVLAVQFHLEADPSLIERWLIGHAHELASVGPDPRTIRADAATHGGVLAEKAAAVLRAWLDNVT